MLETVEPYIVKLVYKNNLVIRNNVKKSLDIIVN